MVDELENWRRTHYSKEISPKLDGKEVIVFGWIEDIRDLGKIAFYTLRDREGLIQFTIHKKKASEKLLEKLSSIKRQYAIGVKGIIKANPEAPKGVELTPLEVKILGEASHPLPLDPTGRVPADLDTRLKTRILDLRRPECRAIFLIKHEVTNAIRSFLVNKGYIEVHTPRIISAAAEGGAALFSIKYFDAQAYLAQSPELYKEQLITVFEKVFEIGTFFRAEEAHTRRHLNEFISVDLEEAFVTMDDVMKTQEEMIAYAISKVKENRKEELETLSVTLDTPKTPFKRYTYDEILNELKNVGETIEWGEDISTPAYRKLRKLHLNEFYFIVDWPSKARPFYIKPKENNAKLSYAFDLMYEWVEVASGGSRVDKKTVFLERLKEQKLNPESFKFYLDVFDYGMPPHAGWGLGLDRLIMALLKIQNIREAVLFPRDKFLLVP
ncbi:aspartate--tRNA(Asn) ligase [Candidatus Bathyarchaeota archaeon]|nr:aspartate--tRNA(Asn) ligase [Candidatus Bathyarchaeota archaeon]